MNSDRMFLNLAIEAETSLMPRELLHETQRIEQEVGRTPQTHLRPREIDIDVLLYEHFVFHDERLSVPHAELAQRRFVLEPLSEIASSLRHPIFHQSIAELLAGCTDRNRVIKTNLTISLPLNEDRNAIAANA